MTETGASHHRSKRQSIAQGVREVLGWLEGSRIGVKLPMARGRAERAARLLSNPTPEVAIPDKLYFRIGEVSELTQTKAYVLRYWETEFPTLRPVKSKSGHRLYRRKDVEMIFEIRGLLYDKGFTLEGARKYLASTDKNPPAQSQLFRSSLDAAELKAIRQELQTLLTMLSRKC